MDNSENRMAFGDRVEGQVTGLSQLHHGVKLRARWDFQCFDKDGNLKWEDYCDPNIFVNEGLDDVLEEYYNGSAYTAAHYIGLVDNAGFTAYAAGDTAAQIGGSNGWAEDTTYSDANRPTYNPAAAASQSIDNSASKASFSINGSATIRGAFCITDNTKGGTAGTLISESDFTGGNRSVQSGDTLEVTLTVTAADDGV
jgi:hypothetical protein